MSLFPRWFGRWFGRDDDPARRRALSLYGDVLALARLPALYGDGRIEDSVAGRLEMLWLHMGILVHHLAPAAGQQLSEVMIEDLDENLRRLGASDPGVGRRVRKLFGIFLSRQRACAPALEQEDVQALARILAGTMQTQAGPLFLADVARHCLALRRHLATQSGDRPDLRLSSLRGSPFAGVPGGPSAP